MSEADDETATERVGREIWIEKYRPKSLSDVVGQDSIVERLENYVERDDLPNLLFAGPAGVGKCVTGETPVLTDRGIERIEDIVGDVDGFADPDDDLSVVTFDDSGEFEYTEPSKVFGKRTGDLVRVETRDGADVTVTPEHRLLVLTAAGLEWRRVEDLDGGERIVRPLRAPLPDGDASLKWIDALDGDRTFVTVSDSFAHEHAIPAEANHVGEKKRVVEALRTGVEPHRVADELDVPRKTVDCYRRQLDREDLDEPARTCSLSYLRDLDVSRRELRDNVESIEYVTRYNKRSAAIEPPRRVTPDLAAFVGLAISEARIKPGTIKFYNTDDELLDRFARIGRDLFAIDPDRGEQKGVQYVKFASKTLTHFLEACFDVFDGASDGDGIGSVLLEADEESRRAFLRAVFDAEGYVTRTGTTGAIELTQKNPDVITLLSYLLAGFGIPSRRSVEHKRATNGSGTEREYHTLRISGASHLERFAEAVGFSIEEKRERLAVHASRGANPNHDTMPAQAALDELRRELYIPKGEVVEGNPWSSSPSRTAHLQDLERTLDAAVERIETAQTVVEQMDSLAASIGEISKIPTTWTSERARLEPLETRKDVEDATGIRSDYLLEYADGRRTPTARRTERLLSEVDAIDGVPDVAAVQRAIDDAIAALGVPYERIAEGTSLLGTDVVNLLENDDHDVASLTRFETVVERVRTVAAQLPTESVLRKLDALDRLVTADLYFDEVQSVTALDEERRVYDLTVPGTRNYVAGRVPTVMHNTTAATAIAREVYGDDWQENFLELNASDDRGIDVVRGRIKDFARTSFGGYDFRIIFLDEADSLCVPPGTEVVTGYPSKPEVKRIEEVDEDGEPIPSVDFETNEIQSDKGKLVDSGVADFFEVELADGREVVASPTHPFFVVDDDGKLVERELRELRPGAEIADFKHDVGTSRCEICGDWTAGRFCSVECKDEGHSREMRGEGNPMHGTEWSDERRETIVGTLSDGGRASVSTVEISRIEYSHRGKAYNISMEGTPNFVLANGILTHNTDDAQSALRRTMEQFSDNTRFILSCNYSSKIIDPIQSRCAVFRFSPLPDEAVGEYVRSIASQEDIEVTDDGIEALAYVADGDMRTAINALQAAAVTGQRVDEAAVFGITASARPEEIEEMVASALEGDFTAARATLDELLTDRGIAGGDVVDGIHRSVWEFDLDDRAAVRVLDRLGEADYRIATGANERVQLEALLASLALESAGDTE